MLLAHTSGLPNSRWFEDDKKITIRFEPGTRFAYSGEGLNLLAMVAETITHEALETIMQREVFDPLKMSRTRDDLAAALRK